MYISISPKDSSHLDLVEKIVTGSYATHLNSREFDQLTKQLDKYDPVDTISRLSGLLTVPFLHANTLRLETLVHLAVARCRGDRKPRVKTIENWCNGILGNTAVATHEDPVEDVFLTNIETDKGNLRLFQGTRASSDYFTQTLVDVLSDSNAPSTWHRLRESVVALLLVSDWVAERVKLVRWHSESSVPCEDIRIKPAIGIVERSQAVCFTDEQLRDFGINRDLLTPFILKPDTKNQIMKETIGHTTLERCPILNSEEKLVLTLPHAVSRAIRRFAITELQRWGDMSLFSHILTSYQANQIEQYGLLEFTTNEKLQLDSKNLSLPIEDWLYRYDTDRYVHVVLVQVDMSCPNLENLDSIVYFSQEEVSEIERYLTQTADSCVSRSDTTEGTTLVVLGGLGNGIVFGADGFPKGWRFSIVWIHDILMLAYEWEKSVALFLKFLKHKKLVEEEGVEFVEIVGDHGLFCLWRNSSFQLIPQDLYVQPGSQFCVVDTLPVFTTRVKQRRNLDRHFIPAVDGKFVTVTRLSLDPEFKSMLSRPIYGSPQHILSGILAGVVESRRGPNWFVGIPWEIYKANSGLFFQVWHGFLDIYERLLPKIESLCQATRSDPIEIRLNFSKVTLPTDLGGSYNQLSDCGPTIDIDYDRHSAEITFPRHLLVTFMQSENHGEQIVVRSIAQAVYELINTVNNCINEHELNEVVNYVLGNTGMRVLHAFPYLVPFKALQMRTSQPVVLMAMEDFVFSKLKLSDGCWDYQVDSKIKSISDCTAFLNKVVDKVWDQLHELLQHLDRHSTVRYVLNIHESIVYSREYWGDMARAISSFYGESDDVYSVTQNINSRHVYTGIAARVILEMATCACPLTGGYPWSGKKLDELLAKAALLIEVATHSDAIKHGLVEPPVSVYPNGEYTLSMDSLYSISVPFSIAFHRKDFDESVFGYDGLYSGFDISEPNKNDELFQSQLSSALNAEFNVTLEESTDGFRSLMDLAVEKDSNIVEMTLGDLKTRLIDDCGFSTDTAKAFITTFGYFHRSAWDSPPSGFDMTDIYPWRLGRRLSVVTRPILVLGQNDSDTVLYGVGTLDLGISCFLSMFEQGHWSTEKSNSEEMTKFIGSVNDSIGHNFTRSVAKKYRDMGWHVRNELKMTQIGASVEYGDIDVLAWNEKGEIQIVECKRLRLASTVAEIAEICSRFCGDAEDELSKHLNRVTWITDNPTCLRHTIGFDAEPSLIDHRLVTNVQVPMSFVDSIPIEVEKIGPLEDIQF